ncbi:MAG TPA: mannose-1-phosphate guanylyltransferase/mannose-6-phosphate isomerase, partial [Burkholderiales bacterium]|nr:mannose-1-phosphate guanylyltransferase/mannose-6-phosphate isomerase [Burkholderiales bacterium]
MSQRFYPVILSGGSGTRLWPMSRKLLPKQFLALLSKNTLFQETALRVAPMEGCAAPIVVCNDEQRFLAAGQLRDLGIEPAAMILEPVGRNTAPAIAVAALAASEKERDALLLVLPSDHTVTRPEVFRSDASAALQLARQGRLATFGIVADAPETGFGYIERGAPLDGMPGCWQVASFREKPDRATAESFLASGRFLWNSGMFAFPAASYLEELERLRPEIVAAAKQAYAKSARDLDFLRLDREAFEKSPSDSIDYAVMEKTANAVVVQTDPGWSDVGTWQALWAVSSQDGNGNAVAGDVHLFDSSGCYVRAEKRHISAIGLENLVIVETGDALLVAPKERSQDVKEAVERLASQSRTEHVSHPRVYRPWGYYESVDAGERFQVKRIMVKPGEALSLQMHHHRAEHWIVVSGTARVTRGDEVMLVSENESTFIPVGTRHRLENPGKVPLYLVEVQSGGYLGEDDIVRFEDRY